MLWGRDGTTTSRKLLLYEVGTCQIHTWSWLHYICTVSCVDIDGYYALFYCTECVVTWNARGKTQHTVPWIALYPSSFVYQMNHTNKIMFIPLFYPLLLVYKTLKCKYIQLKFYLNNFHTLERARSVNAKRERYRVRMIRRQPAQTVYYLEKCGNVKAWQKSVVVTLASDMKAKSSLHSCHRHLRGGCIKEE